MSHPARGAWIETNWSTKKETRTRRSHPARGAWIETDLAQPCLDIKGRTPPGVRGLKQVWHEQRADRIESHPARGAWIETMSVLGEPMIN